MTFEPIVLGIVLGLVVIAVLAGSLFTVHFDMLKEIGASSRSTAILIPHSPANVAALTDQLRTAMIEANQIADAANGGPQPATPPHAHASPPVPRNRA